MRPSRTAIAVPDCRPPAISISMASREKRAVARAPVAGGTGRSQCTSAPSAWAVPSKASTTIPPVAASAASATRHSPSRAVPVVTFSAIQRRAPPAMPSGQ